MCVHVNKSNKLSQIKQDFTEQNSWRSVFYINCVFYINFYSSVIGVRKFPVGYRLGNCLLLYVICKTYTSNLAGVPKHNKYRIVALYFVQIEAIFTLN